MLMQLIHVGRTREIVNNFEAEFNLTISPDSIQYIKNNPKYQMTYLKLKDEYERGLAREYLTSKRRRIAAITEIYEKSMRFKDYELASKQIMNIDDMIEGKRGNAGFNLQLNQTNIYNDMTLDQIRIEKAKLLKQLEHVKLEGSDENDIVVNPED